MSESTPRPGPAPERRIWERERFLARVRSMSRAEVIALGDAVGSLVAEGGDRNRLTRGFALAWFTGPRLSDQETRVLDQLFIDIILAMAVAVSGVDPHVVAGSADRTRGAGASFLDVLFPRRQSNGLTEVSLRLIDSALAPVDPQHAIVATYNAGCAIALRDRIAPDVEPVLTAAWRRAFGELPV
jgi:hypothetical protein